MYTFFVLFFVAICADVSLSFIESPVTFLKNSNVSNYSTEVGNRNGRFFPFFTIIRFENSACGGAGGNFGTCFTRRECKELRGTQTGSCASKRGVCCVVQRTCSGSSNVNNTYFTNPGYPTSVSNLRGCTMRVNRCNPKVCQLRIDLIDFSLGQPGTNGCTNDSMTITGGASQVPIICGDNNGQHVYVDFNGDDAIVLTMSGNSSNSIDRRFNIKLTQIACDTPRELTAASGCLMSYTGITGNVKSLNYGSSLDLGPGGQGIQVSREIPNLNYGVCIVMEPGYCSITWTQADETYSFTVSKDAGQGPFVGTPAASERGSMCNTDYVIIPNAIAPNQAQSADRFCGLGFRSVTSSTKPFVLYVVTNGDEIGDAANRGFSLDYEQNEC